MNQDDVSKLFNEASAQAGRLSDVFHKYADYGVRDSGSRTVLEREYQTAWHYLANALDQIKQAGMPGFTASEDTSPPPVVQPEPPVETVPVIAGPIDTGVPVAPIPDPDKAPVVEVENPVSHEEAAATPPTVEINPPKASKLFNGLRLLINPDSDAAKAAAQAKDAYEKKVFEFYADQPVAYWYGGWNGALDGLRRAAATAKEWGRLLVVVAYNIPNRDASGLYSAGGTSYEQYPVWLRQGLEVVGDVPALWIVEPDALPDLNALQADRQVKRTDLIRNAVVSIKSFPNSWAYLDAGNYTWQREETMVDRLRAAGIEKADGFSLNVSGFGWQADTLGYGNKLSNLLGGVHFVIDTSRNGAGPWTNPNGPQWDDWCNPPGRLLGETPRIAPTDRCDAYLWVKPVGQSDGDCKGGPSAGTWWPQYAIDLAKNKVPR